LYCLQLSSSGTLCFVLHVVPVSPELHNKGNKKSGHPVSRAGEGPGLQVFPGRVAEVTQVSTLDVPAVTLATSLF
jgi:hypothetical protein